MPSGRPTITRRRGCGSTFFASAALAGSIASRNGSPMATPAERRKVRRSSRLKGMTCSRQKHKSEISNPKFALRTSKLQSDRLLSDLEFRISDLFIQERPALHDLMD